MTKLNIAMSLFVVGTLLASATGCTDFNRRPASVASGPTGGNAPTGEIGGPANPALAFNKETGECKPYLTETTRKIDFDACVAMRDGVGGKKDDDSSPSDSPAVSSVPTVPVGPTFLIPTCNGPVCRSAPGTQILIENDSDYMIEIQSPYLVPLNGDAWATSGPARVARQDGTIDMTRVIGPHVHAVWTYRYLMNGGVPQLPETVHLVIVAYTNLGIYAAAPVKYSTFRDFEPERHPDKVTMQFMNWDFKKS